MCQCINFKKKLKPNPMKMLTVSVNYSPVPGS